MEESKLHLSIIISFHLYHEVGISSVIVAMYSWCPLRIFFPLRNSVRSGLGDSITSTQCQIGSLFTGFPSLLQKQCMNCGKLANAFTTQRSFIVTCLYISFHILSPSVSLSPCLSHHLYAFFSLKVGYIVNITGFFFLKQ